MNGLFNRRHAENLRDKIDKILIEKVEDGATREAIYEIASLLIDEMTFNNQPAPPSYEEWVKEEKVKE